MKCNDRGGRVRKICTNQYAGTVVMKRPAIIEKFVASSQMHANSPDPMGRKAQLEIYQKNIYLDVTEAGWK